MVEILTIEEKLAEQKRFKSYTRGSPFSCGIASCHFRTAVGHGCVFGVNDYEEVVAYRNNQCEHKLQDVLGSLYDRRQKLDKKTRW